MPSEWRSHADAAPNGYLYHYTSQDGIVGIVTSGTVWATCIHYLNDSMEWKYALELATDSIRRRQLKAQGDTHKRFYDLLVARLRSIEKIFIYVISFSEAGDLLSQWRAYSGGGPGFSLGFSYNDLTYVAQRQHFHIGRCIYNESLQEKLIEELLDEALGALTPIVTGDAKEREHALKQRCQLFYMAFLRLAPLFKASGFSEEREWRMISAPLSANDLRTFVRPGKNFLTPTLAVPFQNARSRLILKDVIVGPSEHRLLSFDALWLLLGSKSIRGVTFTYSTVPYRG